MARSLFLGGLAGFAVVFAIVTVGVLTLTSYGTNAALASAAFVAAFAGIGFGAMVGGSLHH